MKNRRGVAALLVGMLFACEAAAQEKQETDALLRERVQALEERLDKLDRVDVIKKVSEYLCPGGELNDSLPPGGRCPDGSLPEERATFRKMPFSRRESLTEKIESALKDAESRRVTVGGSARGILQQVIHSDNDDTLFGQGSVDLFFLSKPMVSSLFFVDLEAIGGSGPDAVIGSLSRLNTDAETLGVGVTDQVKVREAWLYLRLSEERLRLVAGKIDLTNYFDRNAVANDETAKFLNSSLVNNPLLRQPPNGPGAALQYQSGRELGVSIGIQSSNNTGATIAEKVYAVSEIDYHAHLFLSQEGNYRVWGRLGRTWDTLEERSRGAGISIDQQISPRVTIFARAGLDKTEGERRTAYAWSGGLEVRSPSTALFRDRTGIAFSRQTAAALSENIAEGYYQHFVTDRMNAALDLQWLFSGTNAMTGEKNSNIVIPGFRTTINF